MVSGSDDPWSAEGFKEGFSIGIHHSSEEKVLFEMRGIDPALANAIRRVLIAEVPTVAISEVTLMQNTSVIHDPNLVHRMGLVPIRCDPEKLKPRKREFDQETLEQRPVEKLDGNNSLTFKLHVVCGRERCNVYSKHLVWTPLNEAQETLFKDDPPGPVVDDIIIAKLAPGQEIECTCRCELGIGKMHTKWSPVCTASYRLVQQIKLARPVVGKDALRLQKALPEGVIAIETGVKGEKRAVIADLTKFTVHRECLEPFAPLGVSVETAKDHYLFSIESVGQIPAMALLEKALTILSQKIQRVGKRVRKAAMKG